MDKFEIGEIAIVVKGGRVTKAGDEVEVVGGPFYGVEHYGPYRRGYDEEEWYAIKIDGYPSSHYDGGLGKSADSLRKRRPPTELSTWEEVEADMGWNPTKQKCNES